ncbi:MAG: hypothetical protein ACYTHM_08945, partial [Planctomycetota bacterium]
FLFALVNWVPGNAVLLVVTSILILKVRGDQFDISTIYQSLLMPVVYGVAILSVSFSAIGWLPFHAMARLLGGEAPAEKSFRMFNLASAFSLVNILPFLGAALAPLFATVILIRAVSESYELDLFRAFFTFIFAFGILVSGAFVFAYFFLFSAL